MPFGRGTHNEISDIWDRGHRKPYGCLEWTGYKIGRMPSYGGMRLGGKNRYVHHLSWILTHGAIPVGMQVLHRCDNTLCFEPTHLWLGTQADNMRDKVEKGRAKGGRRSKFLG